VNLLANSPNIPLKKKKKKKNEEDFEILSLKDIGVMTLTFWGHVTTSINDWTHTI